MTKFDRIREARIRKGLTQDEIAAMVPCSRYTYRRWERDREPKTLDVAVRVCEIAGIDLHYYMTGEILDKLSQEEAMIISAFRGMKEEEQKALCVLLERREAKN